MTYADTEQSGNSDSGTGFAARFGAGADYWLSEKLSVGATYTFVVTTSKAGGRNFQSLDYHSFVMGAQYRF